MDLVGLMLKPKGRIGRRDYWIGVAIIVAVVFAGSRLPSTFGTILLYSTVYLGVCVHGKRLHDIGKSAWGILLPSVLIMLILVLFYSSFRGEILPNSNLNLRFAVSGFAILSVGLGCVVWTIWLGTRMSGHGANKYGLGEDAGIPHAFD